MNLRSRPLNTRCHYGQQEMNTLRCSLASAQPIWGTCSKLITPLPRTFEPDTWQVPATQRSFGLPQPQQNFTPRSVWCCARSTRESVAHLPLVPRATEL
eukprot:scaffold141301_cov30-Tisochrysis_lutea.AAC.5